MKTTLTSILLFLISLVTSAQLTVTVPTVTANVGDVVMIPVKLSGAALPGGTPISSANIQITFDTAVLRYDTLLNFYSVMPVNQWIFAGFNGLVSANWLEPSLLTVPVPNNTTLYEIKFTKKQGSTPLTFVVTEFTDAQYNLITTTAVNGAVNAPAVMHQVTFKVDMSKENISTSGIYLAGSFNNWSTTQNPMTFVSGSTYTATVSLQEGQTYQYRFVNGNQASGMENVPAACGTPNGSGVFERQVTIPASDTTLPIKCFGMCTACPVNVNVTFRVDLQHVTVSPDGVHLAGTFNNWSYLQSVMTQSSPFVYEFSQIMEEGQYHEFLFVNGNNAAAAENPPASCTANSHRYITIPNHDTVLTAYCYDSCLACGSVPQFVNVTFRVDLRNADSIHPAGIHLAGNFQGWNPSATPMATSGDSLFTYTGSFLAGSTIEYKFVNGNTETGYEVVPIPCAQNGNRFLMVPYQDTILKKVCFSRCDTCVVIIGLGEQVEDDFTLLQNSPNPCDALTRIGFSLKTNEQVKIRLFDAAGFEIRTLYNDFLSKGTHYLNLETRNLRSGLYFYTLETASGRGGRQVRKLSIFH
jgi:hypothetical protein